MAENTLASNAQRNKSSGATMSVSDKDRIIHIESRVDRLETDVSEIKSGVKALLNRPASPGFNQVMGTLLSTLATCAIVFGFAEWRLSEAVEPVKLEIAAMEVKHIKAVEEQHREALRLAVLYERAAWLQTSSNWQAKVDKAQ